MARTNLIKLALACLAVMLVSGPGNALADTGVAAVQSNGQWIIGVGGDAKVNNIVVYRSNAFNWKGTGSYVFYDANQTATNSTVVLAPNSNCSYYREGSSDPFKRVACPAQNTSLIWLNTGDGRNSVDIDDAGSDAVLTNTLILGGPQKDVISGGRNTDVIVGNGGPDELKGRAGSDSIAGGGGKDIVEGGAGDDTLTTNEDSGPNAAGDTLNCGSGTDDIKSDPNDSYGSDSPADPNACETGDTMVRMVGTTAEIVAGPNQYNEFILTSSHVGDFVHIEDEGLYYVNGEDRVNRMTPLSGCRRDLSEVSNAAECPNATTVKISSGSLDDQIEVSRIRPFRASLVADTGYGSDLVIAGPKGDVVTSGPDGDTVYGLGGTDYLIGGYGTDNLYGGDDADYLYAKGGGAPNNDTTWDLLWGGKGDDELHGHEGPDWLEGEAGRDRMFGYGGIDFLIGDERKLTINEDGCPVTGCAPEKDTGDCGGDSSDYRDNGALDEFTNCRSRIA